MPQNKHSNTQNKLLGPSITGKIYKPITGNLYPSNISQIYPNISQILGILFSIAALTDYGSIRCFTPIGTHPHSATKCLNLAHWDSFCPSCKTPPVCGKTLIIILPRAEFFYTILPLFTAEGIPRNAQSFFLLNNLSSPDLVLFCFLIGLGMCR